MALPELDTGEPRSGQPNGRTEPLSPATPEALTLRSRAVHAGVDERAPVRPLSPPIYQGSVYAFADAALADQAYAAGDPLYARDGLPNVRDLERAVANLEGTADAHAVASGMAAIATTFMTLLSAGDHVIAPIGCYCDTPVLLTELFTRFGVRVSFIDLDDPGAVRAAMTPVTRCIFAETISNPGMELADLPTLASLAHAGGALLVVDNTFATPMLCRPVEHGADLVLHSAGKFLGGHNDVTAGVVAGPADVIAAIRRTAYLTGPLLAPIDAWLTRRGLQTLAPRMAWISQSAASVAGFLAEHPAVASVRYPGSPNPDHDGLRQRLLPSGGGGILAFDLAAGSAAAARVIQSLRLIPYVPSVGGPVTIASYPPRCPVFAADGTLVARPYQSRTIRLSIGLEDPVDLMADLQQALDTVTGRSPNGASEIPSDRRHA